MRVGRQDKTAQNDMGVGRGGCRGVWTEQGMLWRQWEARERQVGMISSEMGLIVGSDIMRSEFYGVKCRKACRRRERENQQRRE